VRRRREKSTGVMKEESRATTNSRFSIRRSRTRKTIEREIVRDRRF